MSHASTKKVDHPANAQKFVDNTERVQWHDESLWFVRSKRDKAVATIPEWERLREVAAQTKMHMLSKMDEYLVQFEENATKNGIQVHYAMDGEEHNKIVHEILEKHDVKRIVKSKSMLTEECHLNPYLIERGIEVVDTDLGERIVQFREEPPSHLVMPAIHIKKAEIGELFHEKLGTEKGADDPKYLTEAARGHLREKFLEADAGITGVNFAIAETGGIVVCTNEGNADLGTSLPPVHIACMGMEKLLPKMENLGVFTRLLARSATGQPITTYTSHFQRPQSRRRNARGDREQRPYRNFKAPRVPAVPLLHSLRGVHQHLPHLSPQWRSQLRIRGSRPHRLGVESLSGSGKVFHPPLRINPLWLLYRCMPGKN